MLHKITIDVHLYYVSRFTSTKRKKNKKKSNHHFFSTINLPIAKICQRAQRATNVPQGGKTPETHQGRSLAPWLKHTGPRSVLSGARIMKQPGRSSTLVGGGRRERERSYRSNRMNILIARSFVSIVRG